MMTCTDLPVEAKELSLQVLSLKPCPIRVLLIEDNMEQVDWVRLVLEGGRENSYHLDWASGLLAGMNRVQDGDLDVVLLDLGLPELHGYRSHSAIRLVAPEVPVVVLTADASQDSQRMALADGASDYLIKGEITGAELRESLRWAVISKSLRGSRKQQKEAK